MSKTGKVTIQSVKKRIPWLGILLALGFVVSAAVSLFEPVVAQLPVIMSFQSLILGMAGNVGTQSLAVAIRVLMDQQVDRPHLARLVWKEARVGILNGVLLGVLSFAAIGGYLYMQGNAVTFAFAVSGCLGVAMVLAMLFMLNGVGVPVIASGGAGTMDHFVEAVTEGGADAALAASLFHYKIMTIREVKEYMRSKGVAVRL